jgi:hypothetical protein
VDFWHAYKITRVPLNFEIKALYEKVVVAVTASLAWLWPAATGGCQESPMTPSRCREVFVKNSYDESGNLKFRERLGESAARLQSAP